MPDRKRHPLVRIIITALTLPAAAQAQTVTPETLVERLQEGGYVIYIRHAATESDYADQVTADPGDCATQRVLSRSGWAEARGIGEGFERLGIPVGEVLSSEYCRAWQTADLAFGRREEVEALNFLPSEEYSEAQVAEMRARVAPLLVMPEAGTNRVIVGHDDPFEAVTGIYPEPQGVAYVLSPADGTLEVLGSIPPDAWPGL
ncbi:hypothetical protein ACK8OR_15440 [Jannaschia sp. KMU-145]|uniref:hypothetical protein n=1 Tax=Jannaschia halovivens TaxID=3388667 RepID=UPI00396B1861